MTLERSSVRADILSDASENALRALSSSESASAILARAAFISSDIDFLDFSSSSMRPLVWAMSSLCSIPDADILRISSSMARISSRTWRSLPRTSASASWALLSFAPTSASLSSDAAPNFRRFCCDSVPPTMAPEASTSSPDLVTILIPPMILRAWSMSLTTSVSPRTYQNAFWYFGSKSIRLMAYPSESFSDMMALALGFPPIILVSGRNVTRPSLSFFRYAMQSAATWSSSTTTADIFPPAATASAVSYSLSTVASSWIVPWMPCMSPRFLMARMASTAALPRFILSDTFFSACSELYSASILRYAASSSDSCFSSSDSLRLASRILRPYSSVPGPASAFIWSRLHLASLISKSTPCILSSRDATAEWASSATASALDRAP